MSPSHSSGGIAPALRGGAMSMIAPALGAWLLFTSFASAQDASTSAGQGGIIANLLTIGGEEVNTLAEIKLGIADCDANATLEFELDGTPMNKASIDIYTGTNCNRTDRINEDVQRCTYVDTRETNEQTQDLRLELMARDLVEDCASGTESMPTIWFLAVDDPMSAEDVGNNYATYELLGIDMSAPDAPTEVVGGSGENEIPIEWDTDEADIDRFIVFIDDNPTEGGGGAGSGGEADGGGASANTGDCGSSVLQPNMSADDVPSSIRRKEVNEPTATGFELSPGDVGGMMAAVAVVAVDEAGNQSPLSNTACVKVVPTEGFWDRYEANGGKAQGGCPCSALGPAQLQTAWPVALALLLLRRSSRRRRPS
jgi:hypothetical protein